MEQTAQSPLGKAIIGHQSRNPDWQFQGNRHFYMEVGIGQRRFGQLFRGEKRPTPGERNSLAEYFGVPVTDLI